MDHFYREIFNTIRIGEITVQNCPPHFHRDIEIIFVFEGTATAFCNGKRYELCPGSIFFVASDQVHMFQNSSMPYYGLNLIIDPNLLIGPAAQLSGKIPITPLWEDPDRKSRAWELMQTALKARTETDQETLMLLSSVILSFLLKEITLQERNQSGQGVLRILDYCQEHFREPISVGQMAKELYLSRSHISHTFSNILKVSFPSYVNGLRLNEAVRLLSSTNYSITEIAYQAGFSTVRSFNSAFVKRFGISPSKYRSLNQSISDRVILPYEVWC